MIQSLTDDRLHTIVITASSGGEVKNCACFVFMPVPFLPPCTVRNISVTCRPFPVNQSQVCWCSSDYGESGNVTETEGSPDDMPTSCPGLPPTVPVPLSGSSFSLPSTTTRTRGRRAGTTSTMTSGSIDIALVTSDKTSSHIVGLQFMLDNYVVAAWKLSDTFKLGESKVCNLEVQCRQVSGHLSNDGKQVNILTGQGTCRVGYPMPCCLVSLKGLGDPPEWIQIRFIREAVAAASTAVSVSKNEARVSPGTFRGLPRAVTDCIGCLIGLPVKRGPPKRVGEREFKNAHALWTKLSQGGRHRRSEADHKRDNEKSGSLFNPPIFNFQARKQNNSFMHTSAGHFNHYWVSISNEVQDEMRDCPWQVRLNAIKLEMKVHVELVKAKVKELQSIDKAKQSTLRIGGGS